MLRVTDSVNMVVDTLSSLQHLHHLRFHDNVRHLSNPVCQHVLYRDSVVNGLACIITLDGNRLACISVVGLSTGQWTSILTPTVEISEASLGPFDR